MAQETDLKSVGLIACGFESRLRHQSFNFICMGVIKLYEDCFARRDEKCAVLNEPLCVKRGSCPFYATKEEYRWRLQEAARKLKEKGLRPCTKCDGKEMYQSTTKI